MEEQHSFGETFDDAADGSFLPPRVVTWNDGTSDASPLEALNGTATLGNTLREEDEEETFDNAWQTDLVERARLSGGAMIAEDEEEEAEAVNRQVSLGRGNEGESVRQGTRDALAFASERAVHVEDGGDEEEEEEDEIQAMVRMMRLNNAARDEEEFVDDDSIGSDDAEDVDGEEENDAEDADGEDFGAYVSSSGAATTGTSAASLSGGGGGAGGATLPAFAISRVKELVRLGAGDNSVLISKEAALAAAQATSLMLEDLVEAAAAEASRRNRKSVNYEDVATVVSMLDRFSFLYDILPQLPSAPIPTQHVVRRPQATSSASATSAQGQRVPPGADTAAHSTSRLPRASRPEPAHEGGLRQTQLRF